MDPHFFDKAEAALPAVCRDGADMALVLGSGWGGALETDEVLARVPYGDIPGMGQASVPGHSGEFLLYRRHGRRVAAFCGRRHWYEGVGWETVVMNVELARRIGAKTVLLTNASGGLNPALKPGEFVILRDHINTVGVNPLIGPLVEGWGPRFPDMGEVYTPRVRLHFRAGVRDARGNQGVRQMGRGHRGNVHRAGSNVRPRLRNVRGRAFRDFQHGGRHRSRAAEARGRAERVQGGAPGDGGAYRQLRAQRAAFRLNAAIRDGRAGTARQLPVFRLPRLGFTPLAGFRRLLRGGPLRCGGVM